MPMGLFGSLKDFAKATGKEKDPVVIGLDIGTYSIKAVALEDTKEGPMFSGYAELILDDTQGVFRPGGLSPERGIQAVNTLFQGAGFTSKNCGIGIPFASSLATVISVPPLDDEKLQGLIPVEARKYIPVPVADVYLDWQRITPPDNAKKTNEDKVLLFAIHKSAVASYEQVSQALGLESTIFEMEIFSMSRAAVGDQPATAIVADIGASYTRLCVVKDGHIFATRKINRGGAELTDTLAKSFNINRPEAEKLKKTRPLSQASSHEFDTTIASFYRDIAAEIRKLADSHEKEWGMRPGGVALTGGAANIKECESFMFKELTIPCSVVHPLDQIKTKQGEEAAQKLAGPEFAVAAGIALRKILLRS